MNWKAAHKISANTLSIGRGLELEILAMLAALDKKIDSIDRAILLQFLEEELDKIALAQTEALDKMVKMAYSYSLNATLGKLNEGPVVPSLAIGYNMNWCIDNKNYKERVVNNIQGIKSELQGLIIGFDGDPIVLLGLIHDILKKAKFEWSRLIQTEAEACYSQGARDAYLMEGALYAVIENDSPCDAICVDYVGEHQVSLRGGIGVDLPPYHPFCKCVFLGLFGH